MNKSKYKCALPEFGKPQKGGTLRRRPSVLSAVNSRGCASTAIPWMRPHRDKSQTALSRDTWSPPPFVNAILQPVPWYGVKGVSDFLRRLTLYQSARCRLPPMVMTWLLN